MAFSKKEREKIMRSIYEPLLITERLETYESEPISTLSPLLPVDRHSQKESSDSTFVWHFGCESSILRFLGRRLYKTSQETIDRRPFERDR
jgi:hypothetical protein